MRAADFVCLSRYALDNGDQELLNAGGWESGARGRMAEEGTHACRSYIVRTPQQAEHVLSLHHATHSNTERSAQWITPWTDRS